MKFAHRPDSSRHTSIAWRPTLPPLPSRPAGFSRSPTLSSESHAGTPERPPTLHHARSRHRSHTPGNTPSRALGALAPSPISPQRATPRGLAHFNSAPAEAAEAILLDCCGSLRWARRVVAHRPYPDLEALLAACDEAGYDLTPADVHEALVRESSAGLHHDAPQAAHTALAAAHAAYESRFGHAFVICLDRYGPNEHLDQLLGGIRSRLSHEPDEERSVSAGELRALARSRVARSLAYRS
ncbi:2-oxo-4-hydroxy-4-carboxy-5-ureidoimidazoline decarboxylase [Streptomyces sp. NPDC018833]|uniref:2-oxo-4-hydroxy-4-carboxy-5-ureidoimidazoline decarboxylase n=1 Tax=Streptomyces sp. NPDC018833 TaxID=3365053 RepID=UPI0037B7ED37